MKTTQGTQASRRPRQRLEPDDRRRLERCRTWLRVFWPAVLVGVVASWFLEPTLALALSLSSPLVVIVGLIVIPRCPRCDTNLARPYLAIMLHYQGMQCPKCGLDVSEMAR